MLNIYYIRQSLKPNSYECQKFATKHEKTLKNVMQNSLCKIQINFIEMRTKYCILGEKIETGFH